MMDQTDFYVHPSADVARTAQVGAGSKVWHQAQIMPHARLGLECIVGKGAFIGASSLIGNKVKIGNYANIFRAVIGDEAFIGPQVLVICDPSPRSTNADGILKRGPNEFVEMPPTILIGASIGAGAIIAPGVTVGTYSLVAIGSIVHKDVPDYARVAGNPARHLGFACRCGLALELPAVAGDLACQCRLRYNWTGLALRPVAD